MARFSMWWRSSCLSVRTRAFAHLSGEASGYLTRKEP